MTTAFIHGYFADVHIGHLRLFDFAKSIADNLVVGILDSDAARNKYEIHSALKEIAAIDLVVFLSESPLTWIEEHRPDFVVKGREFSDAYNAEELLLRDYGGELIFSSGSTMTPSSIKQVNLDSHFEFRDLPALNLLTARLASSINMDEVAKTVKVWESFHVLTVGDLIVDEYISCESVGISGEDPCMVVSKGAVKRFLGGSGIIASHAKGFCENVSLAAVVSNDSNGEWVASSLASHQVSVCAHMIELGRPTPVKTRFRVAGKTVFRTNNIHTASISQVTQEATLGVIKGLEAAPNIMFLADFNCGALPFDLASGLIRYAKERGIFVVADSQSSSQLGDMGKFSGVNLVAPTEREARNFLHDFDSGLPTIATKLKSRLEVDHVVITLGASGLVALKDDKLLPIPALNERPLDVSGAGDCFNVICGLSLRSGLDIVASSILGSIASAIQVSKVGNVPLSKKELLEYLNLLMSR